MERCNRCLCMAAEEWPKGVTVCRCMDPGEPDGSIRPFGRVLEVFRLGEIGPVVTPVWCRKEREIPFRLAGSAPPPEGEATKKG